MRNPNETNIEFLTRVMDFSRNGALMQAFVLTACEKYADRCIDAGPAAFDSDGLSGEAWVRCANELRQELRKHLHQAD